ncbi:hypothetical protein ID866_4767 [Astraeus odoratus]|nr:hypothetical protein ID866_4767 [Astraeus odoratus]
MVISPTQGDAHTGDVVPKFGRLITLHSPQTPSKKKHVSFGVVKGKVDVGLPSPISPPPPPPSLPPSPSPSPSEPALGGSPSVTTLVNTSEGDRASAEPTSDTLIWEDRLNSKATSASDAAQPAPNRSMLMHEESKEKTRHISMLPSSTRVRVSRFSVPVPPRCGAGVSPNPPPVPIHYPSTPTSQRRSSRRFSTMSTASSAGSAKVKKGKRASRWSQHVNSPETQEVLKALRDM